MKIQTAAFELSAPDLAACPKWALPEFAFIGRSNVGKSSLINLLTGRRELALVSDTPGKTRLINFYVINGRWSLVDLPGYGFAQVAKRERAAFNEAVAEYLEQRRNLAGVFVLIDVRLPPQPIDLEFVAWLQCCRAPHYFVFTKGDKQSATQSQAGIARFVEALGPGRNEPPETFLTSSRTKVGRTEVLGRIAATLAERNRAAD